MLAAKERKSRRDGGEFLVLRSSFLVLAAKGRRDCREEGEFLVLGSLLVFFPEGKPDGTDR